MLRSVYDPDNAELPPAQSPHLLPMPNEQARRDNSFEEAVPTKDGYAQLMGLWINTTCLILTFK
jgi:hypothetical protein